LASLTGSASPGGLVKMVAMPSSIACRPAHPVDPFPDFTGNIETLLKKFNLSLPAKS